MAPKAPTLEELVELDLAEQVPKKTKQVGLFEALIGSAEPLYYDSLENPEKYRPEDVRLLEELVKGKKLEDLTPAEKQRLDMAVHDFSAAPRIKPPVKVAPKLVGKKEEPPAFARPGVDTPEADLPPFWWL